jgi:hypothetical protein
MPSTQLNHRWTDDERDIVRREYKGSRASAQAIADKVGVSFHAVKGQVSNLGLQSITDRKPWSPEENAQLQELLHQFCARKVAKLMQRSVASVVLRAKRLRISRRIRDGWFTKMEVCEILGVDHKWVQGRIDRGELKASWHNGSKPQHNGMAMWHIDQGDLVEFITSHARDLNGRNVDLPLVVMLLREEGR